MTRLTAKCFSIYSLQVPSSETDNHFTPIELVDEKHVSFNAKKFSFMPSSTTEMIHYNSTNLFGIDQRQFVTKESMSESLFSTYIIPDISRKSSELNYNLTPSNGDASIQHSTSTKNYITSPDKDPKTSKMTTKINAATVNILFRNFFKESESTTASPKIQNPKQSNSSISITSNLKNISLKTPSPEKSRLSISTTKSPKSTTSSSHLTVTSRKVVNSMNPYTNYLFELFDDYLISVLKEKNTSKSTENIRVSTTLATAKSSSNRFDSIKEKPLGKTYSISYANLPTTARLMTHHAVSTTSNNINFGTSASFQISTSSQSLNFSHRNKNQPTNQSLIQSSVTDKTDSLAKLTPQTSMVFPIPKQNEDEKFLINTSLSSSKSWNSIASTQAYPSNPSSFISLNVEELPVATTLNIPILRPNSVQNDSEFTTKMNSAITVVSFTPYHKSTIFDSSSSFLVLDTTDPMLISKSYSSSTKFPKPTTTRIYSTLNNVGKTTVSISTFAISSKPYAASDWYKKARSSTTRTSKHQRVTKSYTVPIFTTYSISKSNNYKSSKKNNQNVVTTSILVEPYMTISKLAASTTSALMFNSTSFNLFSNNRNEYKTARNVRQMSMNSTVPMKTTVNFKNENEERAHFLTSASSSRMANYSISSLQSMTVSSSSFISTVMNLSTIGESLDDTSPLSIVETKLLSSTSKSSDSVFDELSYTTSLSKNKTFVLTGDLENSSTNSPRVPSTISPNIFFHPLKTASNFSETTKTLQTSDSVLNDLPCLNNITDSISETTPFLKSTNKNNKINNFRTTTFRPNEKIRAISSLEYLSIPSATTVSSTIYLASTHGTMVKAMSVSYFVEKLELLATKTSKYKFKASLFTTSLYEIGIQAYTANDKFGTAVDKRISSTPSVLTSTLRAKEKEAINDFSSTDPSPTMIRISSTTTIKTTFTSELRNAKTIQVPSTSSLKSMTNGVAFSSVSSASTSSITFVTLREQEIHETLAYTTASSIDILISSTKRNVLPCCDELIFEANGSATKYQHLSLGNYRFHSYLNGR